MWTDYSPLWRAIPTGRTGQRDGRAEALRYTVATVVTDRLCETGIQHLDGAVNVPKEATVETIQQALHRLVAYRRNFIPLQRIIEIHSEEGVASRSTVAPVNEDPGGNAAD